MKNFNKLKTSVAAESVAVAPRVNKFAMADAVMTPTVATQSISNEQPVEARREADGQDIAARLTLSLPQEEADAIEQMRTALAKTGRIASKSELIRAAIMSFRELDVDVQSSALAGLEKLKPGRKVR